MIHGIERSNRYSKFIYDKFFSFPSLSRSNRAKLSTRPNRLWFQRTTTRVSFLVSLSASFQFEGQTYGARMVRRVSEEHKFVQFLAPPSSLSGVTRSHLVNAHSVDSTFHGVVRYGDSFNDGAQIGVEVFPELQALLSRVYIVGTSPNDKAIGAEIRDLS